MSRKAIFRTLGILAFLFACGLLTLYLLLRSEPTPYQKAQIPPGPERIDSSSRCAATFSELYNNASGSSREEKWVVTFTEKEINSYFAEDFIKSNLDQRILPSTIRDPRVILKKDKICLAFRYRKGLWSTIVSLEFRAWLPSEEPNVIALELQSLRAGRLPINAQSLLGEITRASQKHDIKVRWYRYQGNPTALVRFQADKPQTTVQLSGLEITEGKLKISGQPVKGNSRKVAAARAREQFLKWTTSVMR